MIILFKISFHSLVYPTNEFSEKLDDSKTKKGRNKKQGERVCMRYQLQGIHQGLVQLLVVIVTGKAIGGPCVVMP